MKELFLTLGVMVLLSLSPVVLVGQAPASPVSTTFASQETGYEGNVQFLEPSQLGLLVGGNILHGGDTYGLLSSDISDLANMTALGGSNADYLFEDIVVSGVNIYATVIHIPSNTACYAILPKAGGGSWQDFAFPAHTGGLVDYFDLGGNIHVLTENGDVYVLDELAHSLNFVTNIPVDVGLSQDLSAHTLDHNTAAIAKMGSSPSFYFLQNDGGNVFLDEIETHVSRGFKINNAKILAVGGDAVFVAADCVAGNASVSPGVGMDLGELFTSVIRFDRDQSKSDADRISFLALGKVVDIMSLSVVPAEDGAFLFFSGNADSTKFSLVANHQMSFHYADHSSYEWVHNGWNYVDSDWSAISSVVPMRGQITDAVYQDSVLLFSNDASVLSSPSLAVRNEDGDLEAVTSPLAWIDFRQEVEPIDTNTVDTTIVNPPDTSGNDTTVATGFEQIEETQDIAIYSPTGHSDIFIKNNSNSPLSYYVCDLGGRILVSGDTGIGLTSLNLDGYLTPVAIVKVIDPQGRALTKKLFLN